MMEEALSHTEGLLVVVDESDGTMRTVDYIAKMIGQRRGFRVHLLHLLPPLQQNCWSLVVRKIL